MSTHPSIDKICVAVTLLALLLTILFINGRALGLEAIVDEDAEQNSDSVYFTANDLDGDWDRSSATTVSLEGGGGNISGSGAYFYDDDLVIANAGRYVLSGTLDGGSIRVDAYDSSKVWILLDGVTVTCADDACFRVEQADKVFLTLAEGSENVFSSGASYSEEALADNTGGAVFAHDDLTINGSGSLTVTAEYKHAIDANDDLVICGGAITLQSAADAIHVNDSFRFCSASLRISAGDDGIHSDTSVYIESGTIGISECYEGIEAVTIEQSGGDITIYCSDDGLNANGGSGIGGMGGSMAGGMGGFDFSSFAPSEDGETPDFSQFEGEMPQPPDFETGVAADSGDAEESESYIRISGGSLSIVNESARDADGIDSNGSIYITGGDIRVSMPANGGYAMDVGSESGGVMEISGGTLVGCGSYSMAESFDSSSSQPSILYTYSAGAAAGTTVALEDAEGKVLLSYTAPCAFTCVNLSCPELNVGETYLVVIGDNVEEITLTEVSAAYGDAQSGGFGGAMNFGGMQPRENGGAQSGGFAGRGGRRGRGETAGAESSEGESFAFPGAEDGERPTPPEGFQFSGEDGEGAFPGGGDRSGWAETGTASGGETDTASDGAIFSYDSGVWLRGGASLAALLLGLGCVLAFRRRGGA